MCVFSSPSTLSGHWSFRNNGGAYTPFTTANSDPATSWSITDTWTALGIAPKDTGFVTGVFPISKLEGSRTSASSFFHSPAAGTFDWTVSLPEVLTYMNKRLVVVLDASLVMSESAPAKNAEVEREWSCGVRGDEIEFE